MGAPSPSPGNDQAQPRHRGLLRAVSVAFRAQHSRRANRKQVLRLTYLADLCFLHPSAYCPSWSSLSRLSEGAHTAEPNEHHRPRRGGAASAKDDVGTTPLRARAATAGMHFAWESGTRARERIGVPQAGPAPEPDEQIAPEAARASGARLASLALASRLLLVQATVSAFDEDSDTGMINSKRPQAVQRPALTGCCVLRPQHRGFLRSPA